MMLVSNFQKRIRGEIVMRRRLSGSGLLLLSLVLIQLLCACRGVVPGTGSEDIVDMPETIEPTEQPEPSATVEPTASIEPDETDELSVEQLGEPYEFKGRVRDDMPEYTFALSLVNDHSVPETYVFVQVWDEGENLIQEQRVYEVEWHPSKDLKFADLNFDGYRDLIWSRVWGGANGVMATLVWNPDEGQFDEQSIAGGSSFLIDYENQRHLAVERIWAAGHSFTVYEYRNGESIRTRELVSELLRSDEYDFYGLVYPENEEDWFWHITEYDFDGEKRILLEDFLTGGPGEENEQRYYDEYESPNSYFALHTDVWEKLPS